MSDLRRTTATYPVRSNVNAIEWVYDRTDHGSNEGLIMEVAMNAMPAVTRPDDSGIRPRHGGVTHSARPHRALARRPHRVLARRPHRVLARRPHRVLGPGDAPRAALRLTRRGRVVAAAVAA